MSTEWESRLTSWAKAPSVSERERMENAERAIREAVGASAALRAHSITVFPTGSFRNRTHVRQESDVDISVLCTDSMHLYLPATMTRSQVGLSEEPAAYTAAMFRADLQAALNDHFGEATVRAGNKAFDIHENSYRVDADVVACFDYRHYFDNGTFHLGTAVLPKMGGFIANYPKQHYDNGYAKHQATQERYRKMVRCLKNLAGDMADADIPIARETASFLIESLVWNVPDDFFNRGSYKADMREILAHTFNATLSDEACKGWVETNGVKYLFHISQPWTREKAHSFLSAAWDYMGLE